MCPDIIESHWKTWLSFSTQFTYTTIIIIKAAARYIAALCYSSRTIIFRSVFLKLVKLTIDIHSGVEIRKIIRNHLQSLLKCFKMPECYFIVIFTNKIDLLSHKTHCFYKILYIFCQKCPNFKKCRILKKAKCVLKVKIPTIWQSTVIFMARINLVTQQSFVDTVYMWCDLEKSVRSQT